jgi:hypothetical protein
LTIFALQTKQEYQYLSRDGLLRLALERDQLTADAQIALDVELGNRRITASDLASFKAESLGGKAEQDRHIDSFSVFSGSVGKKFFGRKRLTHDPRFRIEEYDTTLWFFAFWFPIFPIASYRIRRLFHRPWRFCTSDEFHVLQKLPQRDWEQILLTWIKAVLVLLLLRFALPLALRHFVYR